jgi:dual specificity MAP kinase phosphatase
MNIIDNLFLGNMEDAKSIEFITKNSIDKIINITLDIQNYFDSIEYLNIKIDDSKNVQLNIYFDKVFNFINEDKNKKILIHCRQGKSRSASFVISYLMYHYNMNLITAYNYVKKIRNIIQPNIHFMNQLINYEKELFDNNSLTIWDYMNKTKEEYDNFMNML